MPRARKVTSVEVAPEPQGSRVRALLKRFGPNTLIALAIAGGAAFLFSESKNWIAQQTPAGRPNVVLLDRPAWMHEQLAKSIAQSIPIPETAYADDGKILDNALATLKANPWVQKVKQVRREFGDKAGDTLTISCDFRTPAALVQEGNGYWLIDANGIKLPERYDGGEIGGVMFTPQGKPNLRLIVGVQADSPEPGEVWHGRDLQAGLELISLLQGQPYADEITEIDVSRVPPFGQGYTSDLPQITLHTKYASSIYWGRPASADDAFKEPPAAQKLKFLSMIYTQYGRVDAMKAWIDLRFEKPTHRYNDDATASVDQR